MSLCICAQLREPAPARALTCAPAAPDIAQSAITTIVERTVTTSVR
jgi:hypothetical protein